MRCEEIMTRNPATLRREASVQEAARLMADKDVGFVPVCDDQGACLGVLTDRDIAIRVVAKGGSAGGKAADLLSRELVCCNPQDDVSQAKRLMQEHKVSRILCCDDQRRPLGVISLQDLAMAAEENEVGKTVRDVKEATPSVH